MLNAVDIDAPVRVLDPREVDVLIDLAVFTVTARTAVERDGYDREVVVMPAPEAPARLSGALSTLLAGLEAVGAPRRDAWPVVTKTAWDCIPDMRRRLLTALHASADQRTADLVISTGIPKTTAERTLEDLRLLGLVDGRKESSNDNAAWRWNLTPTAVATWPSSSPETSGTDSTTRGFYTPNTVYDDFSGEHRVDPEGGS